VDDIHRRLTGGEQLVEGLVDRGHRPVVAERDGPLTAVDHRSRAAGAAGEVVAEETRVAEGCRHEEELRAWQPEQRDLPGPAAVRLGVEVELVHDDLADVGVRALA
jgi:hypothetical protein